MIFQIYKLVKNFRFFRIYQEQHRMYKIYLFNFISKKEITQNVKLINNNIEQIQQK